MERFPALQRAQRVARDANLDPATWTGVSAVAPRVSRWRYRETLAYVDRIAAYYRDLQKLDAVPLIEMNLEAP